MGMPRAGLPGPDSLLARLLLEEDPDHLRTIGFRGRRSQQARACSFAELESLIPSSYAGKVFRRDLASLFPDPETCRAGRGDEVVVVTGSIYLLGEIMARINPGRGPGEGRLQDF